MTTTNDDLGGSGCLVVGPTALLGQALLTPVSASGTRRVDDCAKIDRYVGHVPGHLDQVWLLRCD